MITGLPLATINRLPVLLLPGDIFARRNVAPVLQQLESPATQDISVNDCFKPVSRYWDRIQRPEQLLTSLPEALRVLTSPAETGAVTLCLPQDVQAEAFDFPEEFFGKRVWLVPRSRRDEKLMQRAVEWFRGARNPLIVAGGGVLYSEASEALVSICDSRQEFRSAKHRQARERCRMTIRKKLAPLGQRAHPVPISWPGKQTWCSASEPATAISRPLPKLPFRILLSAS